MRGVLMAALTKRVFGYLPSYYEGDQTMEAILDAVGRELERLETRALAILEAFFPQNATDTYRQLSVWEMALGLPVAPSGITLETRVNLVLAALHSRHQASGADWVANVNKAMGGTPWTYIEGPGDYQVSIFFPFASGSFSAAQVYNLTRSFTPAHLELIAEYNEGFIVDVSEVGEDRL